MTRVTDQLRSAEDSYLEDLSLNTEIPLPQRFIKKTRPYTDSIGLRKILQRKTASLSVKGNSM